MSTDKYVSVRIRKDQFEALKAFAGLNYSHVNSHVQQAVDNFIQDEVPVWMEAAKKVRKQLKR